MLIGSTVSCLETCMAGFPECYCLLDKTAPGACLISIRVQVLCRGPQSGQPGGVELPRVYVSCRVGHVPAQIPARVRI